MALQSGCSIIDVTEQNASQLTDLVGEYYGEMARIDPSMYELKDDWRSAWPTCVLKWIGEPLSWAKLAFDGERPVGFVMFCCNDSRIFVQMRRGYVSDIYVKPEYRHTGLGLTLFQLAIDVCREAGAQRLDATVHKDNLVCLGCMENKFEFVRFMHRLTMQL